MNIIIAVIIGVIGGMLLVEVTDAFSGLFDKE